MRKISILMLVSAAIICYGRPPVDSIVEELRCYPKNKAQVSHLFDLAPRTEWLTDSLPVLNYNGIRIEIEKDSGRAIGVKLFSNEAPRPFYFKNDSSGIEVKIFGNLLVVWRQTIERDEWAWLSRADIFFKDELIGQGRDDEEEHLIVRQSDDYVFLKAKKSPVRQPNGKKKFSEKIIIYGPSTDCVIEYPDSSWCVDSLGQRRNCY